MSRVTWNVPNHQWFHPKCPTLTHTHTHTPACNNKINENINTPIFRNVFNLKKEKKPKRKKKREEKNPSTLLFAKEMARLNWTWFTPLIIFFSFYSLTQNTIPKQKKHPTLRQYELFLGGRKEARLQARPPQKTNLTPISSIDPSV